MRSLFQEFIQWIFSSFSLSYEVICLVSEMPSPTPFLMINYDTAEHSDNPLPQYILHCRNPDELTEQLTYNPLTNVAIACHEDELPAIAPVVCDRPIDKFLVVKDTDGNEGFFPAELLNHPAQFTAIREECHLKRYLCTTAVVYLHQQAQEHKENGNFSLANLCLRDALHALNCATQYKWLSSILLVFFLRIVKRMCFEYICTNSYFFEGGIYSNRENYFHDYRWVSESDAAGLQSLTVHHDWSSVVAG